VANTPITSFQEIESEWESVLHDSPANTLFLTPQWQKVWWDTFGDGRIMCGFAYPTPDGGTGNGMAAIASLAKSGDTVSFMGSQDTFDYNDFPIRPGHERDTKRASTKPSWNVLRTRAFKRCAWIL